MSNEEINLKDNFNSLLDLMDTLLIEIEQNIDLAIMNGYSNEQWFLNCLDRLNRQSLKKANEQSVRG